MPSMLQGAENCIPLSDEDADPDGCCTPCPPPGVEEDGGEQEGVVAVGKGTGGTNPVKQPVPQRQPSQPKPKARRIHVGPRLPEAGTPARGRSVSASSRGSHSSRSSRASRSSAASALEISLQRRLEELSQAVSTVAEELAQLRARSRSCSRSRSARTSRSASRAPSESDAGEQGAERCATEEQRVPTILCSGQTLKSEAPAVHCELVCRRRYRPVVILLGHSPTQVYGCGGALHICVAGGGALNREGYRQQLSAALITALCRAAPAMIVLSAAARG